MTIMGEMPNTVKRTLAVGFNVVANTESFEVPIGNFMFNAILDDKDQPIAPYVGIYQGVVQLRNKAEEYFWVAISASLTLKIDPIKLELVPANERGSVYDVQFTQLIDPTAGDFKIESLELKHVAFERPVVTAREPIPSNWDLVEYQEFLGGDKVAILQNSGAGQHKKAIVNLSKHNEITSILVDGTTAKHTKSEPPVLLPQYADVIADIEYSYLTQRYANVLGGKENPIIAAGKRK